jgi:predicted  nucleic acid-binding Zn-ribbon protein
MLLLAITLSVTEVIILSILGIVSAAALYFFLVSRKNLQRILHEEERRIKMANAGNFSNEQLEKRLRKRLPDANRLFGKIAFQPPKSRTTPLWKGQPIEDEDAPFTAKSSAQLRRAIEDFYDPSMGRPVVDNGEKEKIAALKIEVETLQQSLEEKNAELHKIRQQYSAAQKIATRMDDVYREYDLLQQKMADLETQASKANTFAIELEDARETGIQLKKDLVRKQAKLQDMIAENGLLHQHLSETEDKLEEANLQRKQLMKKVQMLESINIEFQQVSDTNKKLQNELRRIGELESMLSMMVDERDNLLQRKR